jgi:hypothetical protein
VDILVLKLEMYITNDKNKVEGTAMYLFLTLPPES